MADEKPATSLVPRMPGYDGPVGASFDPEQARRLLADAGYPNGVGFPEISISFNTLDTHSLVAQAIQEMWKDHLNIDVGLHNMQWKVFLQTVHSGDFDLARSGWIGDYPDPMAFLETWDCGASNNLSGYCSPDYEALLNQARGTMDSGQRAEILVEAETRLLQDLPLLPIYHYTQPYLLAEDLVGFEPNWRGFHLFKYMSWRGDSRP